MARPTGGARPGRIVLGLGGTVDYEVSWDGQVIADLVETYGIRPTDLDDPGAITSERDLVVAVLAFLRAGAGGERFVASSEIIEQFAARLQTRVTLGGTCVRAAIAMSTVGVGSTLHLVSMNEPTRRLLPADVDWVSSAARDTQDPHLIVQYPPGARVRAGELDVVAPRPNRVILANDPPHRELVISDELGEALADAALFLISSLNVISDRAVLEARLDSLRHHLARMPEQGIVMFEDAGYHVPEFAAVVRDAIAPAADLYSLNEDELQAHLDRSVDLLEAKDVAAAVEEFAGLVQVPALVLHTTHLSLAYGPAANLYRRALAGGNTMAATRYRCGDGFTATDYEETAALALHEAGIDLARELRELLGPEVVCVPARDVQTPTPTTIGLGDTFVGGFVAALVPMLETLMEPS